MRAATRLGLPLALLTLSLLAARVSEAKSEYVRLIAGHLTLPYEPPCRVCHIQGTTGPGSVQTPFGVSMLAHGLTGSQSTVTSALDGLAADKTDSDGDGHADVDELRANTDPNTAADVALAPSEPTYGCAIASGPKASSGEALALAGLLLALALGRRRAA